MGQRLSPEERTQAIREAMQRIGTAQAAPVAREVKRYFREERGIQIALDREAVTKDLQKLDKEIHRWEDDQMVRSLWRDRRAQIYRDANRRIEVIDGLIRKAVAKADAEPPGALVEMLEGMEGKEAAAAAKEVASVYGAVASSRLMGKVAFASAQAAEQEKNLRELMDDGPYYERVQQLAKWLNEKAPELRAGQAGQTGQAGRGSETTFAHGRQATER